MVYSRYNMMLLSTVAFVLVGSGCVSGVPPVATSTSLRTEILSASDNAIRMQLVGAWSSARFEELNLNSDGSFGSFEQAQPRYIGTWSVYDSIVTLTSRDGTTFTFAYVTSSPAAVQLIDRETNTPVTWKILAQ